MRIATSLMWAGAAKKPEQSRMTFKNHQNDSKQLGSQTKFDQNQIKDTEVKDTEDTEVQKLKRFSVGRLWFVSWVS